ncbi:hypothetical protein SAMN05421788_106400 [Filimonas lacunae]|uniref:Uncharacterized protein n=1 Tax=Filimonas lacunae TaxID=477680 RepID=A0A173MFX7_9BACT|nr:tetratricopeptide repeat protein [Filimonas lacunae]BAV06338.1 membrane protein [Filimonas lacunae]SIT25869.1 hypothetical protein SAMN05421788_106400 [Filimonas lacunae]
MFFGELFGSYYYLIPILQIICIIHALRTDRKNWIFALFFLPVIGCIIYLVQEILPAYSSGVSNGNARRSLFPNFRIKELEKRLKLANTDANRLALADEYTLQQQYDKAIALTLSCLTGLYANDPDLLLRMARLYTLNSQYTEGLAYFTKALPLQNNRFNRPEDEIMYARTLDGTGENSRAEEEYKRVIRVHHSMEAMYYYGMLLKKQGRTTEARTQFQAVQKEKDLHPKYVRRMNYKWIRFSRIELRSLK